MNLSIEAIRALCEEENICAIKEASDSADRLVALSAFSDRLTLYAGNDSQTYTALSLGGAGVISVLSNVDPCAVSAITSAFWRGDENEALRRQTDILKRVSSLFLETNPSPIKYAMHLKGFCESEVRLPLYLPNEKTKNILKTMF